MVNTGTNTTLQPWEQPEVDIKFSTFVETTTNVVSGASTSERFINLEITILGLKLDRVIATVTRIMGNLIEQTNNGLNPITNRTYATGTKSG